MALRKCIPAVLAVLFAGACTGGDDPFGPGAALQPGETLLVTDAPAYEIRREDVFHAVDFELTYRNTLDVAVAVPACHSPARPMLQKLVGGTWVHAFSSAELMCLSAPLVIPAKRTHHFRYRLRADTYEVERWSEAVDGSLEGTYRLRWWVGVRDRRADSGVGDPLPEEYAVSNSFELGER
ncbi:hypothetical protein [Longimicrobium sp.]|uniref:hypothetical protein n=1 Tax=Longimicrobium sp. TaxID=2029185 RepID=UPI002F92A27C